MTASVPPLQPGWYLRGRLRLRHLQLMLLLDEVHNVGVAAQRMATTQPAVSRMLAELEDMLGARLFERTAKGTFPTPHGDSLIRHARWVLGDLERMSGEWSGAPDLDVETIHLGVNSAAAAYLVPRALLRFEQQAANVNVLVREGSLEALVPDLHTRKLDLLVARMGEAVRAPDTVAQVLYEEPMCICARSEHPLAGQARVSWQQLAAYPWIMPPRGSPARIGLDMLLQRHGLYPASRIESASALNNMMLMASSDLLSLLPRCVARNPASGREIAILDIELPPVFGPLGIVRHHSLDLSPRMQRLIECLRAEAAEAAALD
ncbi:LysR family transcriptional regulator [Achromobacter anxifer]|jgi:DNA-binding transcriptional LysR family regulator|uniref:LysR family transcriptional regulator n=1 Tax=Achromobacter anxifer TaxID=1287737 RepID=UPI0023F6E57E|nr:LysR family transcriptional regulator [Achromobacter anxifer]MDF8365870.1 LysR family transcriptional regulator [Achromobacter anxifer]